MEDSNTIDTLKRVVYDKSGAARESFYITLADWMLTLRDRYGFAPKLLPLFLTGFHDDLTAIRDKCRQWMEEMGQMYERDYAEQLKDEMDFSPDLQGQGINQGFSYSIFK